jgi:hypothetical protein
VSGKKDTGGNYLYAQEVQTDTDAADQVGRVSKAEASAVTEVEVHFRSSYLPDYIT